MNLINEFTANVPKNLIDKSKHHERTNNEYFVGNCNDYTTNDYNSTAYKNDSYNRNNKK